MARKGAIAAGHSETAAAAAAILEDGGNAFDAALAGLYAACIAEPVLTSLGGGGFLLARPAGGEPVIYDFFAHTPKSRKPAAEVDFRPIVADFGTAQQEFHIGIGSMATPGTVKGLLQAHRDLGSMQMRRIVEPAAALAREGVVINRLQAYILQVVGKIYTGNDTCRAVFGSRADPQRTMGKGETFSLPGFAETLEAVAREGADLFDRGELAQRIAEDCRTGGGAISAEDLAAYRVVKRPPLARRYGGARFYTNPPPSTGGILIAFALELLKDADLRSQGFGTAAALGRLATVMALTNKARLDRRMQDAEDEGMVRDVLDPAFLEIYRQQIFGRPEALSGTTHISVIDARGNAAGLSVTNGEGSGYMIPGTGIMINNMLGEEDIHPHGFHRWPEDTRICSMMAPTLVDEGHGRATVMGSGGSNRIRTAILQVLLNMLEFDMPLEAAVTSPRIHFEGGVLSIEAGFDAAAVSGLADWAERKDLWDERNLFFGGVHSVRHDPRTGRFEGAGDPRRGGVAMVV